MGFLFCRYRVQARYLIYYFTPVEPKPPAPLTVSESSSASVKDAVRNGVITSWTILSPGSTDAGFEEWLCMATMNSQR